MSRAHLAPVGVEEDVEPGQTVPLPQPRSAAWLALLGFLSDRALVPLVGTAMVGLLAPAPYEGLVLAFLALACAAFMLPATPPWAHLMRVSNVPLSALRPALGLALLWVIQATTGLPGLDILGFLASLVVATVVATTPIAVRAGVWARRGPIRTAVIGSARSTQDLDRELRLSGNSDYLVIGQIRVDGSTKDEGPGTAVTLGSLSELSTLVEQHSIELLVMAPEAPRARVFDEVARSCLHLPVRLWELSGFYEEIFGHVPVGDINAAWFQYIMHPRYRAVAPLWKRPLDLAVAGLIGLAVLPLVALAALLIRRDGGPVLFKQIRIGEGGRPLAIYKLRSMVADASAEWASADDPRITRIGRLLRRMHLDEVPQLLNVLRGEMSLVGPRPEQPEFVDRLESLVPFYQRRHLVKPGLTGWAQVRCGYAGSDIGSAWKVCHDLYYVKHRSMVFDLAILAETLRTLFGHRHQAVESSSVAFLTAGAELDAPAAPAVARGS